MSGVCERATGAGCRPPESGGLDVSRTVVVLTTRGGPAGTAAAKCG
eukprot:CAMPEP_0175470834 /NCGR_PEP_ID=MMETSP0095-20121207/73051_1 /TAXON_ID=311494 /ORGANISM="Alexandrium monilatum, Strain CCMP3105" /LENGTH=45 /DNA_ID= /DNA_START= /DNA_END= /DNA_ORIENTATION=